MLTIYEGAIWKSVQKQVADNGKRKPAIAAIAYVSALNHFRFEAGDTLLCDASEEKIAGGATDARALRSLTDRGVLVYSIPKLHAKVLVCGDIAVIGSANLSDHSATASHECALVTDRADVRRQLIAYINRLKDGRIPLTIAQLDVLTKIIVLRKGGRAKSLKDGASNRLWIIRTVDIKRLTDREDDLVIRRKEATGIESELIRFAGKSAFRRRARTGDWVIQVHGGGKDTKPGKLKVYPPTQIDSRHEVDMRTLFFMSEVKGDPITFDELKRLLPKDSTAKWGIWFAREANDTVYRELARKWRRL